MLDISKGCTMYDNNDIIKKIILQIGRIYE